MTSGLLFDEDYYLRINEARWAMAGPVIHQARGTMGLETCLDVGCGPGWFSERLAGIGLRVDAVDGRRELLDEAARRVPGVRFHHGDVESDALATALPISDLVFCFGLLYHVENPFRVIRSLRRWTRRLLFLETMAVPGSTPWAALVAEGRNETQGLTHHAFIASLPALVKMLHVAGFTRVYEYTGTVAHEDFEDTPERHRRRRVLVAAHEPLALAHLREADPVDAPKFDFTRRRAGSGDPQ